MMTAEELIAFEDEVAAAFNRAEIRAPVHLTHGNEEQLIDLFRYVKPRDWVLGSWRMHYHCLLKGVPRDEVMAAILAGRSITLCFPEHRVLSSAIVGGVLPIAVGLGLASARRYEDEVKVAVNRLKEPRNDEKTKVAFVAELDAIERQPHVWVFVGDMTAAGGAFAEATRYAAGHGLPITFVVEDNGLSVCTPTIEAWGSRARATGGGEGRGLAFYPADVRRYSYCLEEHWPHAGAGKRVNF